MVREQLASGLGLGNGYVLELGNAMYLLSCCSRLGTMYTRALPWSCIK